MPNKSRRGAHFTRAHQRMAQSHRTHESLSAAGRKGYQATLEKHGPDVAFDAARRYRLKHPSYPEQVLEGVLKHLKVEFEREWRIDEKHQLAADFYLPETRQVIEVNSSLHNTEKQRQYDERKQGLLRERDIPCLTVWDEEILDHSQAGAVTGRLTAFIEQGRERAREQGQELDITDDSQGYGFFPFGEMAF